MPKASKEKPDAKSLDLDADAWPKFEALIKSAAKMGPKPHAEKKGREPKPAPKVKNASGR